jgi:quinoprotein glucose dehydrogenase
MKYYKIFLLIFIIFILLIFNFLPNECQNDFKNYFRHLTVSNDCKQSLRFKIIRRIKSNDSLSSIAKNFIRFVSFNSKFLTPQNELIRIFDSNDIEYVNSQINNEKSKVDLKGIHDNYSKSNSDNAQKNIFNQDGINLDWIRSHGDNFNRKFSNSDFINTKNISDLKLIWKFEAIKEDNNFNKYYKRSAQVNPIYINNKLIVVFPDDIIRALDPDSGKVIWEIRNNFGSSTRRGILGQQTNVEEFLYVSFGNRLFKYNAKNGIKINSFGSDGSVKVNTMVAPVLFKDLLVVANLNEIVLFESKTGKKIKEIKIYGSNKNFIDGNIWGGIALDSKNSLLFVSTGNPAPATYGVKRKGKNERSNSLIAINLDTYSIIWDFQETAHDLWDFDIPAPPIIHDLSVDNKKYETVIVPTKSGNTIILERKTGKPIFDISYKKAPRSDILGEYSEPYQLSFEKPERFSKIEYSKEDYAFLNYEKRAEIENKLSNAKFGWYETPSFNKDLITFGLHGGAQWHGAAIDPLKQYLYIPVNNVPWKIRPFFQSIEIYTKIPEEFYEAANIYNNKCSGCHGNIRNGQYNKSGEKFTTYIPSLVGNIFRNEEYNENIFSEKYINFMHKDLNISREEIKKIKEYFSWWDKKLLKENTIIVQGEYKSWSQFLTKDNLPASNPPWGYIAKLDLNTGKLLYKAPIGYLNIENKKEKVGTTIYGGVSTNKGNIIFANGTEDGLAYALDAETGKELWNFQMKASGSTPPIIFMHNNRQYVSFLSSGGTYHNYKDRSATLYTFTILK